MHTKIFINLLLSHCFKITALSRFMDDEDLQFKKYAMDDVTISDEATKHIACFDLQWVMKDLLLHQNIPHTRINGHICDYILENNTCYVGYLTDVGEESHAYLIICDIPHIVVINLYGGSCRVHYRLHSLEKFMSMTSQLYHPNINNKEIVRDIFGFDPVHERYLISRSPDDYYLYFNISNIAIENFIDYILYLKKNISSAKTQSTVDSLVEILNRYYTNDP